jgi:hypothetical protein
MLAMKPKRRGTVAMKKQVGVRLSDALLAEISQAAAEDKRKLSDWIRLALEDVLAARKGKGGKHA